MAFAFVVLYRTRRVRFNRIGSALTLPQAIMFNVDWLSSLDGKYVWLETYVQVRRRCSYYLLALVDLRQQVRNAYPTFCITLSSRASCKAYTLLAL